ncbi:MAG: hypothetical protein Q9191_001673 [Dirinaria sp. TL-2023a]
MAAGPHEVSKSWNYSFSYGRASESMFTSAVIQKLTSLSPGKTLLDAAEEEDEVVQRPEEKIVAQEETYGEFCSSIYNTLLRDVDRRGLEHGYWFFTSKAQNECALRRRSYSTDKTRHTIVRSGEEYLGTYSDYDDSGNDGPLHNLIRRIIAGQEKDEFEVERAWHAIKYRLHQMDMADRYLQALGISPPLGQRCCDFNTKSVAKVVGSQKYVYITKLIWDCEILFPEATEQQGRPFWKCVHYLTAALHHAGLTLEEVDIRVKNLAKMVDMEVDGHRDLVKRDPEIFSKRQKVFEIYGKVLRSVSPQRRAERRSRGLSLTESAS